MDGRDFRQQTRYEGVCAELTARAGYYLGWFVIFRFPALPALGPTFTWSFSGEPSGKVLEDDGRGGRGERWAVGGNKRT